MAGPLSDRLGRKRPLMVGLLAYFLASVACALARSATVLVLLRLVQGLAGAAGIVISRAIARDLYSGRALMIFFSRLLLIAGLAPVVAPILGGQLSRVMSWRGIFGVLAGFGAALLLAGWFGLKETLPPERRIVGGFRQTVRSSGSTARRHRRRPDSAAARHRDDRGQRVRHDQLCGPGESGGTGSGQELLTRRAL